MPPKKRRATQSPPSDGKDGEMLLTSATGPSRSFSESQIVRGLEQLAGHANIDRVKSFQADAIKRLFVGVDTLCIFPTGAGKTLCFEGVVVLYDLVFNGPPPPSPPTPSPPTPSPLAPSLPTPSPSTI